MAYNKDTDYQAIINDAVAKGDYITAAKAEQSRNEKIADLNATGTNKYNATATNKYAGWLDTTDYGTIGKQQMASGASADEVLKTYNSRLNKAANTQGLTQYANDEIQQQMLDYITNYNAEPTFDYNSYVSSNPRPTYTSSYSENIDALLNQILNREDFTYDAENDPLYQQYATMYNREGNRSMNDTLAAAASNAGGMNSYAVTAAQQANDYYASQLADRIPELYQLAYEMYLQDKASQVENLGLLQSMDNTQYNRYRDTMSDWYNDRDFAYNMYRDDMGDYQWNTAFDYNISRDEEADRQWQTEWDYNTGTNDRETAYNRAMDYLSLGVMPSAAILETAGISASEAAALFERINGYSYGSAGVSGTGSSGGGSGSGGSNSGLGGTNSAAYQSAYERARQIAASSPLAAVQWLSLSSGVTDTQMGEIIGALGLSDEFERYLTMGGGSQ